MLIAPILAGLAYAVGEALDPCPALLATVPAATRKTLFASLAATSGALLGFAVTGLTILLSLGGGPGMRWLMRQDRFRAEAQFLFTSAVASLGFATVVFLFLIVAATDTTTFWQPWGILAVATVALVVERVTRLVFFFHDLMGMALAQADGSVANPDFDEPLDD